MRVESRWLPKVSGLLAAALLLQGCLLERKEIFDVYRAVFGISEGVEQDVFSWTYLGPGQYCVPMSRVGVNGMLTQSSPLPSQILFTGRYLNEQGGVIASWTYPLSVNEQGAIKGQSTFPSTCFSTGQAYRVSLTPVSGSIEENAEIRSNFFIRAEF